MRLSRSDRAPGGTPAPDSAPVTATDGPADIAEASAPDGLWSTLSVAGVATAVLGPDATVEWCNPAFADLSERAVADVLTMPLDTALGVERPDRLRAALAAIGRGGSPLQRLEVSAVDWAGTKRSLALSGSPTNAWSEPGRYVVVAENLTSERRGKGTKGSSALDAAQRASSDALTGLPNRATFDALFESSLRRAARTMVPLAVMVCNLDGFRVVNERLGDAAGDELLQGVAARLTHTLRHHDLLARFTGDEFIVVAEEVGNESMAHQVARRLAGAISEPLVIDGVDVRIGVSIGFTLAAGHERPNELLAEAERAVQGAKRAGRGRSMSLSQLTSGANQSGPATIDWNELAIQRPDSRATDDTADDTADDTPEAAADEIVDEIVDESEIDRTADLLPDLDVGEARENDAVEAPSV